MSNFIEALRTGRRQDLAADIEAGHQSTAICHMANIAWRVGAAASVAAVRERMKDCEHASNALEHHLGQLDGNGVDLAKQPLVVGPMLTYDRKIEQFTGPCSESANAYLKRSYREPFVIADSV